VIFVNCQQILNVESALLHNCIVVDLFAKQTGVAELGTAVIQKLKFLIAITRPKNLVTYCQSPGGKKFEVHSVDLLNPSPNFNEFNVLKMKIVQLVSITWKYF